MKISKIHVKNKNTDYSIFIGNGAIKLLSKQIKILCPKTKKIGLILDKNIPKKYKREIRKQIKNYKVFVHEYVHSIGWVKQLMAVVPYYEHRSYEWQQRTNGVFATVRKM